MSEQQEEEETARLRYLRGLSADRCPHCGCSAGAVSLLRHELASDSNREARRNLRDRIASLEAENARLALLLSPKASEYHTELLR